MEEEEIGESNWARNRYALTERVTNCGEGATIWHNCQGGPLAIFAESNLLLCVCPMQMSCYRQPRSLHRFRVFVLSSSSQFPRYIFFFPPPLFIIFVFPSQLHPISNQLSANGNNKPLKDIMVKRKNK